ncbi:MAG: TonB-dependent siderophore receptor [Gammaproteobacteria bacterium]|nr:TonB-dependent siderophore receptor [Gammaproteobacteria bacterium]
MRLAVLCSIFVITQSLPLGSVFAETSAQPMEEVVVQGQLGKFGALKSDVPIMETARSVSIETYEQFMNKGALELDDTLAYSAGIIADTFGFTTRGDFPKVRGFDLPEFRDGMQSLSGFYNNTRPEVFTLEQVEVLKGPASVLFGLGSPGGLLNVVTKRPRDEFSAEVGVEYGTFDRKQFTADITGAIPGMDDRLSGRLLFLFRDSDTQIDQVNDDSLVIAPSLTFRPSERTSITVLGDFTKRESDTAHQFLPLSGTINPSASGQRTSNTAYTGQPGFNRFDTESYAITLVAEHELNDVFSFELNSRYRDGESDYQQSWVSFAGNGVPRVDENGDGPRSWFRRDGQSEQFQIDFRSRAEFTTGIFQHNFLAGVSYQDISGVNNDSFLYATGSINVFNPVYGPTPLQPALADNPLTKEDILGVYLHDQISIGDFILTAGVRFDEVDNDNGTNVQEDSEASFSVGALYRFDNGLAPYFNYSESFQPVIGTDGLTNTQFNPEKGRQYEVGLKFQPVNTRHYATLAFFDIEQSNLSNPNSLPGATTQQEGVSKVQGVEFEGLLNFGDVSLESNLSVLDTEDPDGFKLASIPDTQASAWLSYHPEEGQLAGFSAGLGVRHVGKNESNGFDFFGNIVNIDTPSYTVGDAMLGYDYDDWIFSLNFRNLADKKILLYLSCTRRLFSRRAS